MTKQEFDDFLADVPKNAILVETQFDSDIITQAFWWEKGGQLYYKTLPATKYKMKHDDGAVSDVFDIPKVK